MRDLASIEDRLEKAIGRIEDAFRNARRGDPDSDVSALAAENAAMQKELEKLRKQRDDDVEQLDKLIAQLGPLVDEVV